MVTSGALRVKVESSTQDERPHSGGKIYQSPQGIAKIYRSEKD